MRTGWILFLSFIVFYATEHNALANVVLMIGDSHTVGEFGQRLHDDIATLPNVNIASYGSWGSSPSWWRDGTATNYELREWDLAGDRELLTGTNPTPLLSTLVAQTNPSVIVVALGANLLGSPADWIDQSIQNLMDEAHSDAQTCLWIGPPSMRQNGSGKILNDSDYAAVYDSLKSHASADGCLLIDSYAITHYPAVGGDGMHYDYIPNIGLTLADNWADQVFNDLKTAIGYY